MIDITNLLTFILIIGYYYMTFITAIFDTTINALQNPVYTGSNITVTWKVSGIQDRQIELGLENAQHPYNKIAINRDVNLTTKSQDWVVPTVPNGIYRVYMSGPNFSRTSDPFSIYTNTTSSTQTGMNTPTPNTPNSGGGTEDNSTRNTIIGAVVGGIFSVIAAAIGANFIRCKCCRDNLSQNDDLESGGNDSRHNGGDGGGEISQDSINNL